MKTPSIPQIVGIATLIGMAYAGGNWLGVPPYAAKASVDTLQDHVEANSLTALYIQLENAIRSGDRNAILRLCWAIQNQTGQKPAGCP